MFSSQQPILSMKLKYQLTERATPHCQLSKYLPVEIPTDMTSWSDGNDRPGWTSGWPTLKYSGANHVDGECDMPANHVKIE